MSDRPTIAAFRPPGERAETAAAAIEAAGGEAHIDPMIAPEPTGAAPRDDADVTILTSTTAAELTAVRHWSPNETYIAAIGPKTAEALEAIGIEVDLVPERYTSAGLVEALGGRVDGARIELARSDHGSDELPDGLQAAGGYVHETALYRLVRPDGAGTSVTATIDGQIDALAFSSSLTVEHFLAIAEDQGVREALDDALTSVAVGVIGPPTARTATDAGIAVDVVASEATFVSLIEDLMAELEGLTRSA